MIKDLLFIVAILSLLFGLWWFWSENSELQESINSYKEENKAYQLQLAASKLNIETLENKITEQNKKIDLFFKENEKYKEDISRLNEENQKEIDEIEKKYQHQSIPSISNQEEYSRWLRDRALEY